MASPHSPTFSYSWSWPVSLPIDEIDHRVGLSEYAHFITKRCSCCGPLDSQLDSLQPRGEFCSARSTTRHETIQLESCKLLISQEREKEEKDNPPPPPFSPHCSREDSGRKVYGKLASSRQAILIRVRFSNQEHPYTDSSQGSIYIPNTKCASGGFH